MNHQVSLINPKATGGRRQLAVAFLLALMVVLFSIAFYRSFQHPSLDDQIQVAIRAFDVGDRDTLLTTAEAFRGVEGYQSYLHLMDGMLLLGNGRLEEAVSEFKLSFEQEDTRVQAYALAGTALYRMQRFVEAERALSLAVKFDPSQLEARRLLAATYYDIGAMREAVAQLMYVAKQAPMDPRPHRLLGLINKDFEKYEDATIAYRESLRRDPNQRDKDEIANELAECLIEQFKYSEALESLSDCPLSASLLTLKAKCYFDQQDLAKAQSLAQQAIELDSDHLPTMLLMGMIAIERDEAAEAVSILSRAVKLYPGEYEAHFQLAQAYQRTGQKESAEKHFERMQVLRALRERFSKLHNQAVSSPADAEIRYQLGLVATELGKPELARSWFTATLGLDPRHAGALQALKSSKLKPTQK